MYYEQIGGYSDGVGAAINEENRLIVGADGCPPCYEEIQLTLNRISERQPIL